VATNAVGEHVWRDDSKKAAAAPVSQLPKLARECIELINGVESALAQPLFTRLVV
jgi:hypothetical protein